MGHKFKIKFPQKTKARQKKRLLLNQEILIFHQFIEPFPTPRLQLPAFWSLLLPLLQSWNKRLLEWVTGAPHESRGWRWCRSCQCCPVPPRPPAWASGTAAPCPEPGKTYPGTMTGNRAQNQYRVKVIFLRNNYHSHIPRKSSSEKLCTFEDNFLVLI